MYFIFVFWQINSCAFSSTERGWGESAILSTIQVFSLATLHRWIFQNFKMYKMQDLFGHISIFIRNAFSRKERGWGSATLSTVSHLSLATLRRWICANVKCQMYLSVWGEFNPSSILSTIDIQLLYLATVGKIIFRKEFFVIIHSIYEICQPKIQPFVNLSQTTLITNKHKVVEKKLSIGVSDPSSLYLFLLVATSIKHLILLSSF